MSGKVVGSDGANIGGAHVTVVGTSKVPWTSTTATTAATGTFSFSSLAAGNYRVCAQAAGTVYLNNCQWSKTPATTTITAGASVSGFVVTLQKGVALPIQLNDPSSLASSILGASAPSFLIGADTPNGFQPATLKSKSSTQFNHSIVIPLDTNVAIELHSGQLQFALSNGTAVGNSTTVQVSQASTSLLPPSTLVFQITGVSQ